MCELKKHLFELAIKFKFELMLHNEKLLDAVYKGCLIITDRFKGDDELLETLNKLNNKYTFMELKRIKDDDYKQYELLKNID